MIFDDLKEIQGRFGFLPAGELEALSRRTGTALSHIHGVADFFPHFLLTPPPKVTARVCSDMSCHLRGADAVLGDLRRRFGTMDPKDLSLGAISCLGQCDGAPAMQINDHSVRGVSSALAEALVIGALGGSEIPQLKLDPPQRDLASNPYSDSDPYQALRALVESRSWDAVIQDLKDAGLSGFGGAGFPTGVKWEAVRKTPASEKYVVCNADESEPGTIKDRFIMTHLAHLVVEGMIICGLTTGARRGFLYIRHEYQPQEHHLAEEIARCYQEGLLGKSILGTDLAFDLELFVSPGGYICGEETALMEAIEGKRAEPRNKPPFPVYAGLWGKPTALNNVETFANVPQILVKGIEWYKRQGANGCAGLKFVGISGDVAKPGVYLVPLGTKMSDIIYQHGGGLRDGKKLKAFAPSGPSSGYLPASMVDVQVDFKSLAAAGSMMGSAAIVICGEGTCMLDMALNAITFFRNESCGKCVPCRVGSQKMVDIVRGWAQGKGVRDDLPLLDELAEAMKLASICGLGQFAHSPISSVIKHFRPEVEAHILEHRCPDGVCPMQERAA